MSEYNKKVGPAMPSASEAESHRMPLLLEDSLTDEEALLALATPPKMPSANVKTALFARIAAATMPTLTPSNSQTVPGWQFASSRGESTGWLTMPFRGIRMKAAVSDDSTDNVFVLVEIAPGARFPDHDHDSSEFGVILTGDVTTGGRLLRAGDIYYSSPGHEHHEVISPSGCTALITLRQAAWQRVKAMAVAS